MLLPFLLDRKKLFSYIFSRLNLILRTVVEFKRLSLLHFQKANLNPAYSAAQEHLIQEADQILTHVLSRNISFKCRG